jgi:hypothetical protein
VKPVSRPDALRVQFPRPIEGWRAPRRGRPVNEDRMADLLFLALGLAAFLLFGAYAAALRRL